MPTEKELKFAVVAVDAAIFSIIDGKLVVLTIPVHLPPHYKNTHGLPGGIIKPDETTDQAVERVLKAKTGVVPTYYEQLATFSAVKRDRRGRVVSIGYIGFVEPQVAARYKHESAMFLPVRKIDSLAYDHSDVLQTALGRLAGKLSYTTIARYLLPNRFTLTELQTVYEIVSKKKFDKRNFRKKMLALKILKDTGKVQEGVKNRPAALYSFTGSQMKELPLVM